MKKVYGNRFTFIIVLSIGFIMALAIGSAILTKNNAVTFLDDGYIISSSKKLEFNSGTTYRINLNEQAVFAKNDGGIGSAELNSFIHYKDRSIALLKNGAFVDLSSINNSIVPYYNITKKSKIEYDEGEYRVQSGSDTLRFKNILVRVSENKFLVAGKNLRVMVPGLSNTVSAEYFEVTYVADGVVLIENDEMSYEVAAEGSKIHVGDDIVIELGTKNITYNGQVKLNMTQVTIDGNENITIVVPGEKDEEEESSTGGGGNGTSDGEDSVSESESISESETESESESTSEPDESESETPTESNTESESNSNSSSESDESESSSTESSNEPEEEINTGDVLVELVRLNSGINSVDGVFQVNNEEKITGELNILIKDINTNREISPIFNLTGTGYLSFYTDELNNNSSYMLSVRETTKDGKTIEYYQRIFSTDSYGFDLKKVLVSEDEIEYIGEFDKNSKVSSANVILKDKDGNKVGSTTTVDLENPSLNYLNLDSNSEYKLVVTAYTINGVTYESENGYLVKNIKTLKKTPKVGNALVDVNDTNTEFLLTISGIEDPDSAITKYTFYIYEYTDLENPVYVTTTNTPKLTLPIGENNISSSENYRYKAVIEYNDNEMIRELETYPSDKFVVVGAKIIFTQDMEETTFNTIAGTIKMSDPDCTVPMPGRQECPGTNNFTITYYVGDKIGYKDIEFTKVNDEGDYTSGLFEITGLSTKTTYDMELRGFTTQSRDVPVIIGKKFTASTKDVETLKIDKKEEVFSTSEEPIALKLSLLSNSGDDKFITQVRRMEISLYKVDINNVKEKISDTKVIHNDEIISLLYNKDYLMTNKFFGIEDVTELEALAQDESGWLYSKYEIRFDNAYDTDEVTSGSNKIEIENNAVTYTISPYFLLDYYAKKREETEKVTVTELEDENSIVTGYTLNARVFIKDILEATYGKTGINNNWGYIYKIYKYNSAIANPKHYDSVDQKYTQYLRLHDTSNYEEIYTTGRIQGEEVTFNFTDNLTGFERGNVYYFTFQIITDDGLYPEEEVIATEYCDEATCTDEYVFNPAKKEPNILFAVYDSTPTSITYMYKIVSDEDKALFGNFLYLQTSNGGTLDTQSIDTQKDGTFKYVTFTHSALETGIQDYRLAYNKVNDGVYSGYSASRTLTASFDGFYNLDSIENAYTLDYKSEGNHLNIIINDGRILERTKTYHLVIKSTTSDEYSEFVFNSETLSRCNDSQTNNCITLSYADMENLQGLNCKVSLDAYYETGLIGIHHPAEYYVFKNNSKRYLQVSPTKKVSYDSQGSGGIYSFTTNEAFDKAIIVNRVKSGQWLTDAESAKVEMGIEITRAGVYFGSYYGTYNPAEIVKTSLVSDNDNMYFSSIIPMTNDHAAANISEIFVNTTIHGLTKRIAQNEFREDDRKIYVELADNEEMQNVATKSLELDLEDLEKQMQFNFPGLKPDSKYYYRVYANILSKTDESGTNEYKKTYLYDYSLSGELKTSVKEASTLSSKDIISEVDVAYKNNTTSQNYSERTITVSARYKNTTGYKVSYDVYDENDNKVFDTENVDNVLDNTIVSYSPIPESFVWGSTKYKLVIVATTTDENAYELLLHEGAFTPHLNTNNAVVELREPILGVANIDTFIVGNSYTVTFNMAINDLDRVIDNGEYYVKLYNPENPTIIYTPENLFTSSDGYTKLNLKESTNKLLKYSGLSAESTYIISIKANTTKNNASLQASGIHREETGGGYFNTGNVYNVSLGTGTGTRELEVGNNIIKVNYENATNLSNITKVEVTIYKNTIPTENKTLIKTDDKGLFTRVDDTNSWYLRLNLTNSANTYDSKDSIFMIIKYYAKDLNGDEGAVGTKTYTNY